VTSEYVREASPEQLARDWLVGQLCCWLAAFSTLESELQAARSNELSPTAANENERMIDLLND
jgi:hypothetical protein